MKGRTLTVRIGIIAVLTGFFLVVPVHGQAEPDGTGVEGQTMFLEQLSNQIFLAADAKQTDRAKHLLKNFRDAWTDVQTDFSQSDRRVVETEIRQLDLTLRAGDQDRTRSAAATLRLCVDALISDAAPLWKSMQSEVMDPIDEMRAAVDSGNMAAYHESLNRFLSGYAMIYPSLVIDAKPESVRRVNQRVADLSAVRSGDGKSNELMVLDQELDTIYKQSPYSEEDRLLPFAAVLGVSLITALFYVSWRKYLAGCRTRRTGSH